jgi:hypothetical protein
MTDHSQRPSINGLLKRLLFQAQSQIAGGLRLLPFILKADVQKLLVRLTRGRFESEQVRVEDFFLLRVRIAPRSSSLVDKTVEGDVALFQLKEDIWCFASSEKASVFSKIVQQILQANTNLASQIFISNREFIALFRGVAVDNLTVKVVQHSEYNREESNVTSLKERKDYRVIFEEIVRKNAVIRRIKAAAYRGRGELAIVFSVSNTSTLGISSGQVELFNRLILSNIAEIGMRQNSLFSNRARRGRELKILRLMFDEEVLSDKTQNLELLRAIAAIEKTAVTVFHANPYVHCLFTDLRNGSSFNIFSSSASSLDIVPSIVSSVSSLMRLYRGISEKFADCDISYIEERPPALEEFFGT